MLIIDNSHPKISLDTTNLCVYIHTHKVINIKWIYNVYFYNAPYLIHVFNIFIFLFQTDKPAIEELHQFLEFQLPRQWAPMYGDLPLGFGHKYKKSMSPSLQFTLMGPKLYVNTMKGLGCLLNIHLKNRIQHSFCFFRLKLLLCWSTFVWSHI